MIFCLSCFILFVLVYVIKTVKNHRADIAEQKRKLQLLAPYFSLHACFCSFLSPSLKLVFEIIKQCLLHHVRHLISFQGRPNQHDRPHWRHNFIWRNAFRLQQTTMHVSITTIGLVFWKESLKWALFMRLKTWSAIFQQRNSLKSLLMQANDMTYI